MPAPQKGEKLNHFIGRYMKSSHAREKFKDPKQRAAVAYSEYRERGKK